MDGHGEIRQQPVAPLGKQKLIIIIKNFLFPLQRWHNEFISWDPDQFCGIDNVSLPTEALWQPDITIEEM